MELDDLKTAWKSIENEVGHISRKDAEGVLTNHKRDERATLVTSFRLGLVLVIAAVIFLGTSRLWAAIKMPMWWVCVFCGLLSLGAIAIAMLIKKIRRINLAEDTQFQVMGEILSIKRFYKRVELFGSVIIIVMIISGVFVSSVPYTPVEIAVLSVIALVCFILEYFFYRLNVKKINEMQTWLD